MEGDREKSRQVNPGEASTAATSCTSMAHKWRKETPSGAGAQIKSLWTVAKPPKFVDSFSSLLTCRECQRENSGSSTRNNSTTTTTTIITITITITTMSATITTVATTITTAAPSRRRRPPLQPLPPALGTDGGGGAAQSAAGQCPGHLEMVQRKGTRGQRGQPGPLGLPGLGGGWRREVGPPGPHGPESPQGLQGERDPEAEGRDLRFLAHLRRQETQ